MINGDIYYASSLDIYLQFDSDRSVLRTSIMSFHSNMFFSSNNAFSDSPKFFSSLGKLSLSTGQWFEWISARLLQFRKLLRGMGASMTELARRVKIVYTKTYEVSYISTSNLLGEAVKSLTILTKTSTKATCVVYLHSTASSKCMVSPL